MISLLLLRSNKWVAGAEGAACPDSEIAGERQEGRPASMLESLQEGWKGPLPHPMPTYNPVTGEEGKKGENILCDDFTSPHPGVNTAMMSQFCSKFWGLLSPTHSDSSQGGQESGGVQEMGGEQKLAPHSGRKTGTRGHTVYRVDCIRIIPHHSPPVSVCLSLCLYLLSIFHFQNSASFPCLFLSVQIQL